MRNIYWILFFLLIFSLTACGSQPTPIGPTITSTIESLSPSASPTQLLEPSQTSTPTNVSLPTAAPTATEVPTESPLPTTAPTEAPTQEQPTPTPLEPGSKTFDSSAAVSENPTDSSCTKKAAFYDDVTIPDDTAVRQSETFTKTWRVRNEGSCTWTGYKLVYAGGEAMNANPSNVIDTTAPGQIIDISVDMEAPKRGGSHTSYWQFASDNGENFGVGSGADGMLWVRVQVDYGSQDQTSSSTGQGTSTSTSNSTSAGCTSENNSGYISTILDLVNSARSSAGLKILVLEDRLSAAAQEHSQDMACNDFISHTGSDGSLWYQRVAAQGYANSNSARENIYVGNPAFGGDAQGAFDWWMNSQIHRDNILNSGVTQIGIAYTYVANSSYGGYYTMVLARP